jgi:hypothetical protein
MRLVNRLGRLAALVTWLAVSACTGAAGRGGLGSPETLAPGVDFFRVTDEALVGNAGPIMVCLVRIDPARARLASALSQGRVLDAEAVADIARRHRAVAAVNGGFFNRTNGEPTGLLKVDGRLVSDSRIMRGAVLITSPVGGPVSLAFDRLSARLTLHFTTAAGEMAVPIEGVDTTRARGRLMLYTPTYFEDTDTAPTGTEWVLDGSPLRITEVRVGFGSTPIPSTGAVLSYGGVRLPAPLMALRPGTEVRISTAWQSAFGIPIAQLESALHIVNGAGLLRREGVRLTEWDEEGLDTDTFTHARHPRTLIGVDAAKMIWLAVVDGRQPDFSIGMTFDDLQRLADRLGLTDALNLDGGGSTTMVVRGQVANRPSDPGGARPVSDAIIVTPR